MAKTTEPRSGPAAPRKHCLEPGCPELVPFGRCPAHRKQERATANRFTLGAYGRKWRRLREAHLAENPFCVECLLAGKRRLGTDVDHIIPHRGDELLMWDPHNLQTLCEPHHGRKTAREVWNTGEI
jgi:5-methylcytosine-specific restriction enzyme A